jgi:hypothetical protein
VFSQGYVVAKFEFIMLLHPVYPLKLSYFILQQVFLFECFKNRELTLSLQFSFSNPSLVVILFMYRVFSQVVPSHDVHEQKARLCSRISFYPRSMTSI